MQYISGTTDWHDKASSSIVNNVLLYNIYRPGVAKKTQAFAKLNNNNYYNYNYNNKSLALQLQ